MKTVHDLKVGDTVWWTDVNRKGLQSGTVEKVGTKLIYVDRYVFRKDSLKVNDCYRHQTLIPDLDSHKEQAEVSRIVGLIRNEITYGKNNLSLEDIKKVAELLRIPTGEKE